MNKEMFLAELKKSLSGLPEDDLNERLSFYGEMIDDFMEEGLGEREAVEKIGSVEKISSQIISDTPITKIVKEHIKPKRSIKPWEIVLLVLGFPLWFSLILAFASVILALYVSVWAIIISLWAVGLSLAVTAVGSLLIGVFWLLKGFTLRGMATVGIALFCAGLSVFWFYGCFYASKGIVVLTGKILHSIKSKFIGRGKPE